MHELSIAQSILTVTERHAAGRPVERVEVKVGHLRQVVPSALEFAFGLLIEGTALDGAELAIEEVPARGRCRRCGEETVLSSFPLACADCGSIDMEMLAGEELLVEALVIEERDEQERFATTTGG
ncbi:MAG: hydrogenase maturation nickel metallochaperone HypA/HybF [Solirubrobacterales bacterium]